MTHLITNYLPGGVCDPKSGACSCAAGWRGALCDDPCPPGEQMSHDVTSDHMMCPGTHGANCTSSCLCQNQGNCHPVTGICHCPMGWTVSCVLSPLSLDSLESTLCDQGEVCANPCPTGTYHVDCKRRCDCYNGAVCDHVTGKCHCLPGFKGAKVGSVCDHCTGCCDLL